MKITNRLFGFLILMLAAGSNFFLAQSSEIELLQLSIPEGWVSGFQVEKGQMEMHEFIPDNQNIDHWSDMITVQIFYGGIGKTAIEFAAVFKQGWKNSCPSMQDSEEITGFENGYAFAFWTQYCELSPVSQRSEFVLIKAIQGKDNFYVIQRAWRNIPGQDEVTQWTRFLQEVYVCDSRISGRECP